MTDKTAWEGHSPLPDSRFWSRVDKRGPDECWPWVGAQSTRGYGVLGRKRATHLCLELHGRPQPEGKRLVRHHCDNPPCVNPRHLAWGTDAENVADMAERGRHRNTRKTHCANGHEYSEENTYHRPAGQRECRICNKLTNDRYRARRRAKALAISEKSE